MTLSSTVGLFSTSTVTIERSPIVINVSLCLFAYLKNYMSKLHQFFCEYYLRPWFTTVLVTLWYVTYFRFCKRHNGQEYIGDMKRVYILVYSN